MAKCHGRKAWDPLTTKSYTFSARAFFLHDDSPYLERDVFSPMGLCGSSLPSTASVPFWGVGIEAQGLADIIEREEVVIVWTNPFFRF